MHYYFSVSRSCGTTILERSGQRLHLTPNAATISNLNVSNIRERADILPAPEAKLVFRVAFSQVHPFV
jgi:hypothetical protein